VTDHLANDREAFLARFGPARRKGSNGWVYVCCPAHEDSTPSLAVKFGEKKVLLQCRAFCSYEQILQAAHLTKRQTYYQDGLTRVTMTAPEHVFDYRNEHGDLLYQVRRYPDIVEEGGKRRKDIRQYRPVAGGWAANLEGVRPVPYRLPQLAEAPRGKGVVIAEGELKVHAFEALGFVATCNSGGAGKWQASFAGYFVGRRVAIFPDNDGPGLLHACQVGMSLEKVAREIAIVRLPGLPPKGDIIDWLKANPGTKDASRAKLLAFIRNAPKWFMPPPDSTPTSCGVTQEVLEKQHAPAT
jgi:hypothetical protein